MTKPQRNAPIFPRFLKASFLAGLLSLVLALLAVSPAKADTTERACGISLQQMGQVAVGGGFRPLAQYLERNYPGYKKPVYQAGYGRVFVRHTGRDFGKPVGTPVRAVAAGRVVWNTRGQGGKPASRFVFIKGNTGVSWLYGHIRTAVRVGQVVRRGQVIGFIDNPRGQFSPHVHITVSKVDLPTRNKSITNAMNAGRAFGRTPGQAQANALRFTVDPLSAFARASGKRC
jgi:murein DD-endopeptidase MepM/ murein hydrolase activator NlpD